MGSLRKFGRWSLDYKTLTAQLAVMAAKKKNAEAEQHIV